jgi:hypothetical protein
MTTDFRQTNISNHNVRDLVAKRAFIEELFVGKLHADTATVSAELTVNALQAGVAAVTEVNMQEALLHGSAPVTGAENIGTGEG